MAEKTSSKRYVPDIKTTMKIPQQMLRANEVDTHKHTCFLTLSHV